MGKKIEKQQVLVANDLIDYAEGGIVSKEFEHSDAGSITLFAFDAGQKLSEHTYFLQSLFLKENPLPSTKNQTRKEKNRCGPLQIKK